MRLRQESVSLFFSEEEKRKLKETADKYNISMSECLRDMILFGNPKVVDRLKGVDVESLSKVLNEIGNKINDLARGANGRMGVTERDYLCLKEEYENLLEAYVTYILEAKKDK